jgi:pimeloyl-ACP methyl ester carboxylesterase
MSEGLDKWRAGGSYENVDGRDIFVRREGRGEEFLLCLHGFPTASFDYHKISDELGKEFNVVAFDMIGYGFSAKPNDLRYTTFDQMDALEKLIAKFGLARLHVLSHDYGNTIIQELLARRSEGKPSFEIRSICFLNGALFPETHRPILAQKILIGPLGALFGRFIPDSVFKKNLAKVFGPDTKPSEEELNDHIELFKFNGGKRIAHRLIRYMLERQVFRERWVDALHRIDVPFLMINGSADPVSGQHLVERFRESVPEQKNIVELAGIGHFPHLEAPAAVLRELSKFYGDRSA